MATLRTLVGSVGHISQKLPWLPALSDDEEACRYNLRRCLLEPTKGKGSSASALMVAVLRSPCNNQRRSLDEILLLLAFSGRSAPRPIFSPCPLYLYRYTRHFTATYLHGLMFTEAQVVGGGGRSDGNRTRYPARQRDVKNQFPRPLGRSSH